MGDFGRGLYRLSLQRGTGVCEEEGEKKKKKGLSQLNLQLLQGFVN